MCRLCHFGRQKNKNRYSTEGVSKKRGRRKRGRKATRASDDFPGLVPRLTRSRDTALTFPVQGIQPSLLTLVE